MATNSISALWIGSELPTFSQMCLSSFARHGYDVQLFTFDGTIVMPEGVRRVDAREILAEQTVFANPDRPGTYAAYANLFRYTLLQKQETTWVDVDVLCLGRLPPTDYLFGFEWRTRVNNAVLRAPRDSELLRTLHEKAAAVPVDQITWGLTGPVLLTQTLADLGLTQLALPRRVLYPIHHIQLWRLWDPAQTSRVQRMVKGSATLHLFNEFLRNCTLPIRDMNPPPGSFMAMQLKAAGLHIDGPPVDVDWVRTQWRDQLNVRGSRMRILQRGLRAGLAKLIPSR